MDICVPVWNDRNVYSLRSLDSASIQQKQFYALLKSEFIKGHYLDIGDNVNYLYVLMYDFENDFKINKSYEALSNNLEAMVANYPNMRFYKNDTLIGALFTFVYENNWKNLPILDKFVSKLAEDMRESPIVVKPIDWILKLLNCYPTDEKNIHKLNVVLTKLLRRLGFGIVPNGEIENRDFSYGDLCALYKREEKYDERVSKRDYLFLHQFSRKDAYKFIEVFIKLATKLILEDKFIPDDLGYIDDFITQNTANVDNKEIPQNTKLHLKAVARWRLSNKKPILDKAMKKFIVEKLSGEQKELISQSLLKIACSSGYIHPKRVETLKKIFQYLGVEHLSIHSQIHRMLTDKDGFAVVEKKSNAVEFTINGSPSNKSTDSAHVIIDPETLHIFEQQTKTAQELLSNIFNEEESTTPKSVPSANSTNAWLEILKSLFVKETWNRIEVENMCKDRGLLLGAVLEQINDFAYDRIEDAVIEDDGEYIHVTLDYKEQLI